MSWFILIAITWDKIQISNYDLNEIATPVNADVFEQLLIQAGYPSDKTEFLIQGFRLGFNMHYQGDQDVYMTVNNLPLRYGDRFNLWSRSSRRFNLAGVLDRLPRYHTKRIYKVLSGLFWSKTVIRIWFSISLIHDSLTSPNQSMPIHQKIYTRCSIKI